MRPVLQRCSCRLRKVLSVAAASLILAVTAQGQALPLRQTVLLKRGQVIVLQLQTGLDSGRSQVGDNISLRLFLPVVVDGMVVLPQAWPVHGRVMAVIPAGKNCKQGKVVWRTDPITTPTGGVVDIAIDVTNNATSSEGHGKRIKKAAKYTAMVPFAVIALPDLVALTGMMTEGGCHGAIGTQDTLPAGAVLSAQISSDTLLSPLP